jgi:hypothetical protein
VHLIEREYSLDMDVIEQIQKLSLHEKLYVMEALWDDISRTETAPDVPQWHKDIIDERERLIAEGKARFIDWEDAKEQIRQAVR